MDLSSFLVKAKVATYASGGEGSERALPDGAKELEFSKDGFRYRDRYYGFNPFSGQEVVWRDGSLVWSMNYYGCMAVGEMPEGVYDFLKEALRHVKKEFPFRGPPEFRRGPFVYAMNVRGDVSAFSGEETISCQGKAVFRLFFHGGNASDKTGFTVE